MTETAYEDRISQIVKTAEQNGNMISQLIVMDLLKDGTDPLPAEQMIKAIAVLEAKGIQVTTTEDGEDYFTDGVGDVSFVPADVRIQTQTINVSTLLERLNYGEIDLSPLFQRHKGLWSETQQSRLIESLMLKIPLPAFYFDSSNENFWVVIDGLQRLTAFQNYLKPQKTEKEMVREAGERPHKFVGLQYLKQFNGMTFFELPRQYVRRINEAQLVLYLVEKGTPDEIVRNIFQRINTGGLVLSDQEIRQALYQGKATRLTEEMATSQEFLKATQDAVASNRMVDREYANRYLAFTELDYEKDYKENVDTFLSLALQTVNRYTDGQIEKIKITFRRTMNLCYILFGKYAFRTHNEEWRRGPLNKALFEAWSLCISKISVEEEKHLCANKDMFINAYHELLQDPVYRNALRGGDISSVRKRIDMTKKCVEEFTCLKE